MSFEDYDTRGVVDAPSRRVPTRAMAQDAREDVRGTAALDANAYERWATERRNDQARSPSNTDRRRMLEREYRDDPRAGSALGTGVRRAVTAATDTALAPVNLFRREPLSAAEAYAQGESLVRDEPVAATRERHRVEDAAHPYAGGAGEAAGSMVDVAAATEAMRGGLRLRALGGVKGRAPTGPRSEAGAYGDYGGKRGLLSDERGGVRALPSFDRRIANGPRPEPPTTSGVQRRDIAPPVQGSRLAQRAEKVYADRYEGDADLARVKEFHASNPDYVQQAEGAAGFLARHPDLKALKLATESNSGMNRELRTAKATMQAALARTPQAPRKSTVSGVVRGGTSNAGVPKDVQQRARITTRALEDAARAGHAYRGPVVRGTTLPRKTLEEWTSKGYVDQKSMWSATADVDRGAGYAGAGSADDPPVLLRLNGKSGVPIEGISKFPHEHEIAFPPGRKWRITGKSEKDGRVILDLEEVDKIPDGVDAPHAARSTESDRRAV